MARRSNKRGLLAPPHAAALAALDFASASQAFDRAMALARQPGQDIEAVTDAVTETADRLLGIPVTDPAHIAQKVRAFGWMNTLTVDLADPDGQRRIATGPNDAAKGLLAIYLDLTGRAAAMSAAQAEWQRVVQVWEAAVAADQACEGTSDAEEEGPYNAYCEAWRLLIDTPAPDAEATVYKLRTIINHGWEEEPSDTPDAPGFYQRVLNDTQQDSGFPYARLLQDACRQSGIDHPVLHMDRQPKTGGGQ